MKQQANSQFFVRSSSSTNKLAWLLALTCLISKPLWSEGHALKFYRVSSYDPDISKGDCTICQSVKGML